MVKALALLSLIGAALAVYAVGKVRATALPCATTPDWHVDAALVLSGDPGHRSDRAAELFEAGRVDTVVVSGSGYGGDDARVLAERIREQSPSARIVIETTARDTRENMRASCSHESLRDLASVAIVTDRHHAPRAWLTARRQCPRWVSCVVSVEVHPSLATELREGLALIVYQLAGYAE